MYLDGIMRNSYWKGGSASYWWRFALSEFYFFLVSEAQGKRHEFSKLRSTATNWGVPQLWEPLSRSSLSETNEVTRVWLVPWELNQFICLYDDVITKLEDIHRHILYPTQYTRGFVILVVFTISFADRFIWLIYFNISGRLHRQLGNDIPARGMWNIPEWYW